MTGAPPYNAQSPTQQHRYPTYESPSKNQRPYYPNNEQPQQSGQQQYPQHPPQTPPAFPSSSISRSPRFSHASSPMPGSLPPPINGAAPPAHPSHLESSTQYQPHSTSGTPSLPPPHSLANPALPGNGVSPYGPSTPHGNPSGRPEGYSQSPSRESESPYHVRGNGMGYGSSMAQEPRRSSPPRDTVCHRNSINHSLFGWPSDLCIRLRSLLEPPTLCLSPVSSRARQRINPHENRLRSHRPRPLLSKRQKPNLGLVI